jgi:4-hydroxy-tetrahydrodipicolinate synthase
VVQAFLAGDYGKASELQLQFALFPSRWMHRGLTPTMKAAMRLIGLPVGDPYPPYAKLDDKEVTALAELLKSTALAERGVLAQG